MDPNTASSTPKSHPSAPRNQQHSEPTQNNNNSIPVSSSPLGLYSADKTKAKYVVITHDASESTTSSDPTRKKGASIALRMWNPIWLGDGVLIAFTVLFVVFFLVTLALFTISEKRDGLSDQIEKNHYSWTYGPTASTLLF
jgi:hypothetical protein